MRMLLHARIPHEEFNAAVRDGSVGSKMKQILEATKAEASTLLSMTAGVGPS